MTRSCWDEAVLLPEGVGPEAVDLRTVFIYGCDNLPHDRGGAIVVF